MGALRHDQTSFRSTDLHRSKETTSQVGGSFKDPPLAPHLSPVQNMYLGREAMRRAMFGPFGFMDTKAMRAASRDAFERLGSAARNLTGAAGSMSGAQQQSIAVTRAAAWAQKVIILDEPTAALGVAQMKAVLDLIRGTSQTGSAVVLGSHSMPHVMGVADHTHVSWRGRRVAT